MKKRVIPVMMCFFAFLLVFTGCGNDGSNVSPSPGATAPTDTSASPSPSTKGFVMGTVTAISGDTITLSVVEHTSDTATSNIEKSVTVSSNTTYAVSGSKKAATLSDIAVGDVITATLSGTAALKIIDNGPDINPDPSSYISPSPSPTETSPSPSANS
jgi:hypothetical protein